MLTPPLQALNDILDVPPRSIEATLQFNRVAHDQILFAYRYWSDYLKLLIKEPVDIQIIQGQQDEGVDLIIYFKTSAIKIGLQVKSYNDIKDEKFREKTMA